MGKIYNIALVSEIGSGSSGSDNFYFDWTQIEDVPYKVTFSFMSGLNTITTAAYVTQVFIDLGQTNNFIAKSQSGTQLNYLGGLLGTLQVSGLGTNCYYYAYTTSNPATFIQHRPMSNNFTVNLFYNSLPAFDYVTTFPPGPYTLMLNLETLD
jgi:hypothetical protein